MSDRDGNGGQRGEDKKQRVDRELIELLNELRVALPGIQVLFAFLLTMPFTQRFTQIRASQRTVFFLAFLCTAVSSALDRPHCASPASLPFQGQGKAVAHF